MTAPATELDIRPDATPGYEIVRAAPDAPILAVIHHPKGSRRWHLAYWNRVGSTPHSTHKTRAAALAELAAEASHQHETSQS